MGNGIFSRATTKTSKTEEPAAGPVEIKPIRVLLHSSEMRGAILRYWKRRKEGRKREKEGEKREKLHMQELGQGGDKSTDYHAAPSP